MKKKYAVITVAALSAVFATYSMVTNAAGFGLIEQGTKGLGNAYAGAAASAEDASTIYFNPAGMTRLSGAQMAAAGHVIMPSAKFSDSGSNVGSTALTGDQGGDGGVTRFVPNFYLVQELSSGMKFGLGINAPFGLTSEYNSTWQGRYQAIKSDLQTVNINPSFAYKVNANLSLGAGVSAQYTKAELTNAVDLRRIAFGTTQQDADAKASVTGKDWGYGFNVGLLYEVDRATRLGLAYRSQVAHTLKGNATFTPTNATAGAILPLVQATGSLVNTSATAKTTLPETISVGGVHEFNAAWAMMADATWTRWSRFRELRVHFGSAQSDAVTPEDWRDTWRYGLGTRWAPGGAWTYRAGVAYDVTPVPNGARRSARIPDNTRRWLALGGGYQASKAFSFDIGYAHIFENTSAINNTDSYGHQLLGTFDAAVNILSAQANWMF